VTVLRKTWPFRIAAVLAGLVLCYLSATSALAMFLEDRSPQSALQLAQYDAQAKAGTAFALLQTGQSPDEVERARGLAREALEREPINVLALRTLGLAASLAGDEEGAREHFALVDRLTSRDLPSQLWWIEQEVAEGDVAGALAQYDAALRTSRRAADILMPVLVEASAQPEVAAALTPILERRPAYFRQFFIRTTDTASDISGAATLGQATLDRGDRDDQDLINRIIMRFGRDGDFDEAREVFTWANGSLPDGNVVNGSFEQPTPFRLFDWEFTPDGDLTAEIAPREDTDSLYLIARVARGLAARQLLQLDPGRYRLDALVGDVPQASIDRPTVGLTCASGSRTVLPPVEFPASPGSQAPLRATFTVAPGCRYQWLNLTASASSQDEVRAWIDDISIRSIR
jgi:tetratricopeptide (TPR) repeat protein